MTTCKKLKLAIVIAAISAASFSYGNTNTTATSPTPSTPNSIVVDPLVTTDVKLSEQAQLREDTATVLELTASAIERVATTTDENTVRLKSCGTDDGLCKIDVIYDQISNNNNVVKTYAEVKSLAQEASENAKALGKSQARKVSADVDNLRSALSTVIEEETAIKLMQEELKKVEATEEDRFKLAKAIDTLNADKYVLRTNVLGLQPQMDNIIALSDMSRVMKRRAMGADFSMSQLGNRSKRLTADSQLYGRLEDNALLTRWMETVLNEPNAPSPNDNGMDVGEHKPTPTSRPSAGGSTQIPIGSIEENEIISLSEILGNTQRTLVQILGES